MTLGASQGRPLISRHCSKSLILFLSVVIVVALSGCQQRSRTWSPSSVTLELPEINSLGELWLIEDPNCFTCGNGKEFLGSAKGKRTIPLRSGWFIRLVMHHQASELMSHLKHPSLTAIGDINLEGSNIKDDDLKYLAKINLRSLNLSRTRITGSGFKYLKSHEKWFSLDIRDCRRLDPKYLVHFKGWQLATITLWSPRLDSPNASKQEKTLPEEARRIICDGKPERVCAVQIR